MFGKQNEGSDAYERINIFEFIEKITSEILLMKIHQYNSIEGELKKMITKHWKNENIFFINDKGRIEYNYFCNKCVNSCKQSFRAELICCPRYISKLSEIAEEENKSDK